MFVKIEYSIVVEVLIDVIFGFDWCGCVSLCVSIVLFNGGLKVWR